MRCWDIKSFIHELGFQSLIILLVFRRYTRKLNAARDSSSPSNNATGTYESNTRFNLSPESGEQKWRWSTDMDMTSPVVILVSMLAYRITPFWNKKATIITAKMTLDFLYIAQTQICMIIWKDICKAKLTQMPVRYNDVHLNKMCARLKLSIRPCS